MPSRRGGSGSAGTEGGDDLNMDSILIRWLRLAAVALASSAAVGALAALPVVPGEASKTPKDAAPAPVLRLGAAEAPRVVLPELAESELASVRESNQRTPLKRLAIGVARAIPVSTQIAPARLDWIGVPGGYAARVAVSSPQAGALRLAVDLAGAPGDVQIVAFGSDDPTRLAGPVRVADIPDRTEPWWSPIPDGETQTIEFFVPQPTAPASLRLKVTAASHLFTTLASGLAKHTSEIGASGSCNVDIQCSPLAAAQAFRNARNAVAQMVLVDTGITYLCTGTLLNDTDPATQIPWFYSANHCFDNEKTPLKTAAQMQTVASTLNTLWFFEAVTCGARSVPSYIQLTNGAQFIFNNPGADSLLVRLNNVAPAGAFFSGWDANAISINSQVVAITHPQGDLKKVSQGTVFTFGAPPVVGGATSPFNEVIYNSGSTEAGSSGGGIWTFDGTQYALRGALWGGSASCSNTSGTDYYSRFDAAYAQLAAYLAPASTSSTDYTDLWWNPNESGWGLNLMQHPSRNIFAVWYTYGADGKRTWFHMPGGTWSATNTFTGTIYATSGGAANAAAFDAAGVVRTPVGTGTLTFADGFNRTWIFSINGTTRTKAITRLPY